MNSAPPPRRAVVTCGPSYEPIDDVRRLTNFSTGKLGTLLANTLARAGWRVLCLKGVMATHPEPLDAAVERLPFSTNDHLLERLRAVPERAEVAAVFHAAALADFKVRAVRGADGCAFATPKILSRAGEVTITLEPATKLISELRGFFPHAKIAGWKYELAGTRDEVFEKGRRQLAENATDACILNGSAYGRGFGLLERDATLTHCDDAAALCAQLALWGAPLTISQRGNP